MSNQHIPQNEIVFRNEPHKGTGRPIFVCTHCSNYRKFRVNIAIGQIIFHFLWDHWVHCGIFENGVLLMYTLEDVSSVANFITAYEESQ